MMLNKNASQGFSLMEMMIVVAILAIIAGVAIPSYLNHVENTRITQARAVIVQVQQDVQRVKLVQGSLGADSGAVGTSDKGGVTGARARGRMRENNLSRFYRFSVVAGASTGQYFFNVTPINTSKKGLYMDQSGNAFKCPDAGSVSSHTGCDSM